jgi:uncharacterized protein (DUF885 family)
MAKNQPSLEERKAHADFESAASIWLEESCEMFPEHASTLGFRKYDSLLGKNIPAVRARHIQLLEKTLARIEALPEALFTGDAWLDRRGLLAHLRIELLFERDLEPWLTNPQTHTGAAINSIFELLVRAGENPAQVLPAVESRLARLPDFLRAGASCVERPDPLWVKLAEQSCEGAVEFLKGLETELAKFSKNPRRLSSQLQTAARAFTEFASAISRKKTAPAGSFAIGRERFEFLIRERLGLDLSLSEARAVGQYQIARHEFLLREAAKRHGRLTAREQIERAAELWNPGKPLLEVYREATTRIRADLQRAGLVTLPKGDALKVLPVPPFLKHQFPTAAYSAPEPFSTDRTGIFWVNDLSLDQKTPARRAAEIRQHHGLELTSVHEGYPGHHLQFVVQFNHPSRWRRLFAHAIFYEGWTMWCEKLAVEHRLVDLPGAELIQLHDALWRANRIVIDCGLQEGTLTPSGAAAMLRKGVGFTAARAKADVNWYTSTPAVPMSYLLGRLEVEKLHARLVTGRGWSLKKFNDWMLSHGALPYSWIVRAGGGGVSD